MSIHKIWEQLCPQPTKKTLYHYTSQAGFLGIIETREIWATHSQYLNDSNEFIHASKLVCEIINEKRRDTTDAKLRTILNEMMESIQGHESINICVCSFSTDRDSLSQWRAYGGNNGGYSIGFNHYYIDILATDNGFMLAKCIYDEVEQRKVLEKLVAIVIDEILHWKPSNPNDIPLIGGYLANYLNEIAPVLKNPAFNNEQEWRLISSPLACNMKRFAFREGKSMIVPYYKFPLELDDMAFSIDEVVIGPTPHINQAMRAAQSLLVRHKLHIDSDGHFKELINASSIPFRNW